MPVLTAVGKGRRSALSRPKAGARATSSLRMSVIRATASRERKRRWGRSVASLTLALRAVPLPQAGEGRERGGVVVVTLIQFTVEVTLKSLCNCNVNHLNCQHRYLPPQMSNQLLKQHLCQSTIGLLIIMIISQLTSQ